MERSDRMWSTGEGNGKPLQYSCLENPMNSMKRENDRIPKEELPRSVDAQYATGDQWRNNSRKNGSLFVCKANHSVSQLSKSMPQPVTLKKLKLNGSMKTYKTF